MINKRVHLASIYSFYSELLTEKQKSYFEDYYLNDYSLAEIAEVNNTSRNAIHKQIKDTENKLVYYESKLGLMDKAKKMEEIIKHLDSSIQTKIKELILGGE